MNRERLAVFVCAGGLLAAVLGIAPGETATSRNSEEDPIKLRDKIVQEYLGIVKGVREDAEFMTAEQERAVEVLVAYRAPEAVGEFIRIITVKSPVRWSMQRGGGSYGGRERRGGKYVACDGLVEIGVPAILAIIDDVTTRPKRLLAKGQRLDLYGLAIAQQFPGAVGYDYVVERHRSAPPSKKALYGPLLKTVKKHRKAKILIHDVEENWFE